MIKLSKAPWRSQKKTWKIAPCSQNVYFYKNMNCRYESKDYQAKPWEIEALMPK
jgi:hypothetical protein